MIPKLADLVESKNTVLPQLESTLKKFEVEYAKRIRNQYDAIMKESSKFDSYKEYLVSKFGKNYHNTGRWKGTPHQEIYQYTMFKPESYKKWIVKMIDEQVDAAKWNVRKAVNRYLSQIENVEKVESLTVRVGGTGFEGSWHIYTNDDKLYFEVEAIYAGGYNIQRLHLRYIVKVKSLIQKRNIKSILSQKIKSKSTAEKEKRRLAMDKKRQDKKYQEKIKKILAAVRELKNSMYWAEYGIKVAKDNDMPNTELKTREKHLVDITKEYEKYYTGNPYPNEEKSKPKYKKEQLIDMAEKGQLEYLLTLKF